MLTAQDVVVRLTENIGAARRPDAVCTFLAIVADLEGTGR
jgi:hypothetical protein